MCSARLLAFPFRWPELRVRVRSLKPIQRRQDQEARPDAIGPGLFLVGQAKIEGPNVSLALPEPRLVYAKGNPVEGKPTENQDVVLHFAVGKYFDYNWQII